jgi:hypothetical protein
MNHEWSKVLGKSDMHNWKEIYEKKRDDILETNRIFMGFLCDSVRDELRHCISVINLLREAINNGKKVKKSVQFRIVEK